MNVIKQKIVHFTDLEVWRNSHYLFLELADDVDGFPQRRVANILADQLLRSCGSMSANIAEGFNRSKKKFLSALDIALGETNETESWLYKARDRKLISPELAVERIRKCRQIGRMLNSLIKKIKARPERSDK